MYQATNVYAICGFAAIGESRSPWLFLSFCLLCIGYWTVILTLVKSC
mgnify:CR=1 FL=1